MVCDTEAPGLAGRGVVMPCVQDETERSTARNRGMERRVSVFVIIKFLVYDPFKNMAAGAGCRINDLYLSVRKPVKAIHISETALKVRFFSTNSILQAVNYRDCILNRPLF